MTANDQVKILREMAGAQRWFAKYASIPDRAIEYTRKAAALLAGAEALERLEAIESTSSTMLPKSDSVSEAQ